MKFTTFRSILKLIEADDPFLTSEEARDLSSWAEETASTFGFSRWESIIATNFLLEPIQWKTFEFRSNSINIRVKGVIELKEIAKHFSMDRIMDAKETTYGGTKTPMDRANRPSFGFRMECDGDRCLRDFFSANKMRILD
jgi:hypothetical protein